jgi:ribosome-binding factor A
MEHRSERVGRLIQEKIGVLIVEGKVKDPRVNPFLSITRVSLSRDLSWADVYVSTFKPEGSLARGVDGLQSAAGFIQAQLASLMRICQTPKLRFHADMSIKEGFEIVKKIDELSSEGADENPGTPDEFQNDDE